MLEVESLPLEYQVFSSCFEVEGAIDYFSQNLSPSTMGVEGAGLQEFYIALCTFHSLTGASLVDENSFKSWIETETTIYESLGGSDGVENYIRSVRSAPTSDPQSITKVIQSRYNRVKQQEIADEIRSLLGEKKPGQRDKIDSLIQELSHYNRSLADPLQNVYDGNKIALNAVNLWELPHFLPTQFKDLNKAMGYSEEAGFCKGAVHAILAPSGRGKSTFAKCLMNHWVENGLSALYINFEEARDHWERVLFTQVTKQNVYEGESLSETEKRHHTRVFQDKLIEWGERFRVNHDPGSTFFEDAEGWIRDVAAKTGAPDVIIIDTIQSMYTKNGSGLPRWAQFEFMMVRLEKLAKDLHCALIITGQENSNRMKEKREVVQQSDAGGALAIIQKSSVTIFITDARSQTENDAEDEYIMQLQIPKNRITGTTFMIDPPLVKYDDTIKSYIPLEKPPMKNYFKSDTDIENLVY